MRIGEASRVSGASVRSLRYYQDEGLIVPGRCSNGYRDYCQSTIDQVHLIRSLLASGLPVSLIRELRPHLAEGSDVSAHQLSPELLARVRSFRDRLAARIADLDTQRSALDAFLSSTKT